uniref:MipA/OmpV family protein n=1 Tax=uncultured Thiotrichaceae bacterium TaxID=298394 RepID=A0A6S6T9M9_9GAMM|nr:MAG: Unknown protein [uncultured Thiotrichaceae bacterium]
MINKKTALLCAALAYNTPLLHADTNKPINLGTTIKVQESLFDGGDTSFWVRPARLNQDGFYLEGAVLPFQAGPAHTLYVGVGFDDWNYKRNDSEVLKDMDDLDRAINLRAGGALKLPSAVMSADLAGDVAGTHESFQAKLRYTRMLSSNTTFRPYAELQWFSADVTDYYFGVNANEVTADRPAYEADSALAAKVGLDLNFPLSPRWELVAGVSLTHYGSEITDSPIVDKDQVWGAGIGLVYK